MLLVTGSNITTLPFKLNHILHTHSNFYTLYATRDNLEYFPFVSYNRGFKFLSTASCCVSVCVFLVNLFIFQILHFLSSTPKRYYTFLAYLYLCDNMLLFLSIVRIILAMFTYLDFIHILRFSLEVE